MIQACGPLSPEPSGPGPAGKGHTELLSPDVCSRLFWVSEKVSGIDPHGTENTCCTDGLGGILEVRLVRGRHGSLLSMVVPIGVFGTDQFRPLSQGDRRPPIGYGR